jgi:cation:H+ antiporter
VALLPRRWRPAQLGPLVLPEPHRVELAILAVSAMWSLRGVLAGKLTLLDSAVLIGLYGVYLRRVSVVEGEAPEPMGVAAALAGLPRAERHRWVGALMAFAALVILLTAVPFGDAVLGAGALVGISPYLLLQWIVPVATETPELVVAFVLVTHGRGGQSIAVLLAGAVSQYTLALGTLPLAFAAGPAVGPLPLPGRERIELLLTVGVALYALASLISLRLSRGDSSIMLALFAGQLLLPSAFTRALFALVFWVIALDVLAAERRQLPALFATLRPPVSRATDSAAPPPDRGHSRRDRSHTRSRAGAARGHYPRP